MNLAELNRINALDSERNHLTFGSGGQSINVTASVIKRAERHDRVVAGFDQIIQLLGTEPQIRNPRQVVTPSIILERNQNNKNLSMRLITAAGVVGLEKVVAQFYKGSRDMGSDVAETYETPLAVSMHRDAQARDGFYGYCRSQRHKGASVIGVAMHWLEEADLAMMRAEETQDMIWYRLGDESLNPDVAERAQAITPIGMRAPTGEV